MEKIFLKLEELFNLVWDHMIRILKDAIKSALPKSIKDRYKKTQDHLDQGKTKAKTYVETTKTKVVARIDTVKNVDYKSKIDERKVQATAKGKELVENAKNLNRKKVSAFILGLLLFPYKKVSTWLAALTPTQTVMATVLTVLTSLGSLAIYQSTESFYERSKKNRAPAAISEVVLEAAKRSPYYNTDKKSIKISSIRVPVYNLRPTDIQVLIIDVTVKTNTQFLTKFIKAKEHIFRDTLLSKMEPIAPAFTLEKEGKRIIKEVVRRELNSFLQGKSFKGEPVQGKVIDVYIDYIMGS